MLRAFLVLVLCAPCAAFAKKPPEAAKFIDKSVITIPVSTRDYALGEIHYDPENWVYGVTSKWAVNAAPEELRFTVFVYPLGRSSEEEAVAQQMADIERSLHDAVKQGIYADLVVGEREPFVVVDPGPSVLAKAEDDESVKPFDPMPKPAPAIEAGDADDPVMATLAASMASPNNNGQRQSFRFTHDGVPVRSLGYVFYRHLFAFKVRVTAPVDSMDDTTFAALADTATRNLVPRIDVKNYGQCGNITLAEPGAGTSKKEVSDAMTRQLILGVARIRSDNCAAAEGDEPAGEAAGGKRIEILYPPDAWDRGA